MKFFLVASAILVVASAGAIPTAIIAEPIAPVVVPLAHYSQYHSQDALGQYSYGYANDLSAKTEFKTADGQTVGAYSYVDAEGKIQHVQYRADPVHGFRTLATNLPVAPSVAEPAVIPHAEPVKDTPEVSEAKSKHLEILRRAEEEAKKSHEAVESQSRSAIQIQSSNTLTRDDSIPQISQPILASPAFGYSYGINYNRIYAINPIPVIAAYSAPAHLIASPFLSSPLPISNQQSLMEAPKDLPEVAEARAAHLAAYSAQAHSVASPPHAVNQQAIPEAPKDLPEVAAARASHLAVVESIKKDIEAEQRKAEA